MPPTTSAGRPQVRRMRLLRNERGNALRDEELRESALARPRHRLAYRQPNIADLAAAYAFGIVRHHPFVDGNKRVALVVAELFLNLSGHELPAEDVESVLTWRALAEGELSESDLSEWISARLASKHGEGLKRQPSTDSEIIFMSRLRRIARTSRVMTNTLELVAILPS